MNYLTTLSLLLLATAGRAQQPSASPSAMATASVAPDAARADALACHELTGQVTDQFAYPLTGATILLRNANKGLGTNVFITNAEGHYIIASRLPVLRNTVMEISAPGYTTLEVPLTDCRPQDITLTPIANTKLKAYSRGKKQLPGSRNVR